MNIIDWIEGHSLLAKLMNGLPFHKRGVSHKNNPAGDIMQEKQMHKDKGKAEAVSSHRQNSDKKRQK